jgi:ribosomal protein S18 acetylase RimI-like enzyme
MAKIYIYDSDTILESEFLGSFETCISDMRKKPTEAKKYISEVTDGQYFVVVVGKDVVGCARTSRINSRLSMGIGLNGMLSNTRFVTSVFVKEEYRGKKLAKKLMDVILKDNEYILLEAMADNTTAVMLYLKSGLKVIDSRKLQTGEFCLLFTSQPTQLRYIN